MFTKFKVIKLPPHNDSIKATRCTPLLKLTVSDTYYYFSVSVLLKLPLFQSLIFSSVGTKIQVLCPTILLVRKVGDTKVIGRYGCGEWKI